MVRTGANQCWENILGKRYWIASIDTRCVNPDPPGHSPCSIPPGSNKPTHRRDDKSGLNGWLRLHPDLASHYSRRILSFTLSLILESNHISNTSRREGWCLYCQYQEAECGESLSLNPTTSACCIPVAWRILTFNHRKWRASGRATTRLLIRSIIESASYWSLIWIIM